MLPIVNTHQVRGRPSHGHRQHAQNLVKIVCGSGDILADRQTQATHHYFATAPTPAREAIILLHIPVCVLDEKITY